MDMIDYTMRGGEHPDKQINEIEQQIVKVALREFLTNKEYQEKGLKWTYGWVYFGHMYVPRHREMIDFLLEKRPYPEFIEVEPTTSCNLKCKMCEHTYWCEKNQHMSFEKFKYILDQFPRLKWIGLTGIGEAYLNPEFPQFLEESKKRGLYIELFDNFLFLNQENVKRLVDLSIDKQYISLDAATKETYEIQRPGSDWDKVISNLVNLDKEKKRHNSAFPHLWFHFIINKDNIHEVEQYLDFINDLNIDVKGVQFTKVLHNYKEIEDMYVEIPRELVDRVIKKGNKLGIPVSFNMNTDSDKRSMDQCTVWTQPFIFVDGTVIPCCSLNEQNDRTWQKETSLGNIFEKPFKEIWYGKAYNRMIHAIKNNQVCESCERCVLFDKDGKKCNC